MRCVPQFLLIALLLAVSARASEVQCACDPARPESMEARACSLCREAERQPAGTVVFFLKDNNPTKPNRWLALPRTHAKALDTVADLTPELRTTLWTAAIGKARELWGDQWGVAVNGVENRSQCHVHIHIGKLLPDMETDKFVVVDGPGEIPVVRDGTGLWIHAAGGKMHVHLDHSAAETVLAR